MNPVLIAILVVLLILFLYALVMMLLYAFVMKKMMWVRGKDPANPCYLRFEDYEMELERKTYVCGYYGKGIRGYIYKERGRRAFQGFVVLSHGLFGTHVQYLIDIDMLCKAGYLVLAYDQYGCGLSDGKNQESLGTGVYVLENVLRDIKKRNVNASLPISLYGHSWGAYCVLAVLKGHPEIVKCVCRSGFVSPTKTGVSVLRHVNRVLYYLMLPLVYPLSLLLIGPRNMISARRGFKNKRTKILLVHAMDDPMVEYKTSQAFYAKKHPQDNVRVLLTEKGLHNSLITEESSENYRRLTSEYKEIISIQDLAERKRREEEFVSSLRRRELYLLDENVSQTILSFLEED